MGGEEGCPQVAGLGCGPSGGGVADTFGGADDDADQAGISQRQRQLGAAGAKSGWSAAGKGCGSKRLAVSPKCRSPYQGRVFAPMLPWIRTIRRWGRSARSLSLVVSGPEVTRQFHHA